MCRRMACITIILGMLAPATSHSSTTYRITTRAGDIVPLQTIDNLVMGEGDSCLAPGSDGLPGSGTPSFEITFGVTATPGMFEIDTTCVTPGNRLCFADCGWPPEAVTPSFTKGIIEIGCQCDCHTDPQCNGYHNIIDWILVRDVTNGTHQPIPDPNPMCPAVTTDVNCDGVTNTTDKYLMYGVLFYGDDADSVFCHPCP